MYTHTGSQQPPGIYLSPHHTHTHTVLDIITHSFYWGAGDSNSSPISPLSQQVPDPFSHLLSLKLAFLNICLQLRSTDTFQEKPEGGLRPQMYQKTRLQHLLNFGAHLAKRFSLCVYTHVYMHTRHTTYVEVRGHYDRFSSLPPYGCQDWNSGHQAWWVAEVFLTCRQLLKL